MIRELVENYADNKNIVDNLNIHILPMANPDGYEYSRSDVSWSSNSYLTGRKYVVVVVVVVVFVVVVVDVLVLANYQKANYLF